MMPKQVKQLIVTTPAEASKLHKRRLATEEAAQRVMQVEIYRQIELALKSQFRPDNHLEIMVSIRGDMMQVDKCCQAVKQRYREAGWEIASTQTNHGHGGIGSSKDTSNSISFTLSIMQKKKTKKV